MGLTIVFHIVTAALRLLIYSVWEADTNILSGKNSMFGVKGVIEMDPHCFMTMTGTAL